MSEENLGGSDRRKIIRIGNTVHRPVSWWTPSVHHLLKYLESEKFKYSPRVLGFDKEGREILTYIEGESGKDGWTKIINDEGLISFAKLLKEYHDVIRNYEPPEDSVWAYNKGGLKDGEIMCHGDFGPWNIVWQNDEPVGIVDWDFVVPAKPLFDVLYALEYSAPFRDDETTIKWHHFPKIPDRKRRIKVFLDSYGLPLIDGIASRVAELQRKVGEYEAYLAKKGIQPQVDWVANGDLEEVKKRADWTMTNKQLFEN